MPKWIWFTLLTVLLWGLWGVVCKAISQDLPAWQLQVISLAGNLPVIAILWQKVRHEICRTNRWLEFCAFGAGLLGCVGNLACFEAMASGGKAAAVIPLTSLYPITTIVLALLFLGERPTSIQTLGIGLSLVAIWLLNVSPDSQWFNSWLLLSLVPIFCWGVGGFIQKMATTYISGERCALAFLLGFLPMIALVAVFPAEWSGISPRTWLWRFLAGLLFSAGNLTVILAYGCGGRAVIVTPVASLYMLVSVPLAVGFLGETIGQRELLGVATAVAAVIALCYEKSIDPAHGYEEFHPH